MAATFWAVSVLATVALTSSEVGSTLGAAPSTRYTRWRMSNEKRTSRPSVSAFCRAARICPIMVRTVSRYSEVALKRSYAKGVSAASIAMMANTTSSSTKVKPLGR